MTDDEMSAVLNASVPCRRCKRQVLLATEDWDFEEDDDAGIKSVICGGCFTPQEIADGDEARAHLRYVGPPR